MVMPEITAMVNAGRNVMGIANVRGQLIPVVNLPQIVGCVPSKGLGILLVTEFARTTQAFAVEEVVEIVRLDWKQALSAEGTGGGLVTSLARLDGDKEGSRLAQVLDVEQILRDVFPDQHHTFREDTVMPKGSIPPGSVILAADDSAVARMMIEQALKAMNITVIMTKSGKEAWEKLVSMQAQAVAQGIPIRDKVALVLTDLEMPEMDGFTLTRNIKDDPRFDGIPVMIHSSLSGTATENHAKSAGADAYVAKFVAEELGSNILKVIANAR
jgi:two-component system chemotaxis response regulator CheV